MHQPVQDRICQGVVTQARVPLFSWQLTDHYRRVFPIPIIHDLQQCVALFGTHRFQSPVIQDQQLYPCQLTQQSGVTAIYLGLAQLKQQTWQPVVTSAMPLLTGLVAQRTSQVGFSTATGAGNKQVLAPAQPLSLGQVCYL